MWYIKMYCIFGLSAFVNSSSKLVLGLFLVARFAWRFRPVFFPVAGQVAVGWLRYVVVFVRYHYRATHHFATKFLFIIILKIHFILLYLILKTALPVFLERSDVVTVHDFGSHPLRHQGVCIESDLFRFLVILFGPLNLFEKVGQILLNRNVMHVRLEIRVPPFVVV